MPLAVVLTALFASALTKPLASVGCRPPPIRPEGNPLNLLSIHKEEGFGKHVPRSGAGAEAPFPLP